MGTVCEDLCTFMIISCWILLRMRNILDKCCRQNQNKRCMFSNFFKKSCCLWDDVENYGRARQATDNNIMWHMHLQQNSVLWGPHHIAKLSKPVFPNHRAAARYRALVSIIPGRERPKETTICYKISLVQLITNLNVILYLSTCHTVYISVLILFMIMS